MILFGIHHRPCRDYFPATGLDPEFPAPRSIRSAQFGPVWAVVMCLVPRNDRAITVDRS